MLRLFFGFLIILATSRMAHSEVYAVKLEHIRQETNLCVPTSVAMVLAAFGDRYSPRELKVISRGKSYNRVEPFNDFTPTWFKDMAAGLRQINKNWTHASFSNDDEGFMKGLTAIEASLKQGIPVLVDTSGLYTDGHTLVIAGMDTGKKRVTLVDPRLAAPGRRQMSYDELKSKWNSTAVGWNGRAALFPSR